jgi:hypothetical protein
MHLENFVKLPHSKRRSKPRSPDYGLIDVKDGEVTCVMGDLTGGARLDLLVACIQKGDWHMAGSVGSVRHCTQ